MKPTSHLTIGHAQNKKNYSEKAQKINLDSPLHISQVNTGNTYTITLKNTQNTIINGVSGIALSSQNSKKSQLGAVISTMSWKTAAHSNLKFSHSSGNCSINNQAEIQFDSKSGSCTVSISGRQLNQLTPQKGNYAQFSGYTKPGAYGQFSQQITYSINHN